jgi:hypothetical protein
MAHESVVQQLRCKERQWIQYTVWILKGCASSHVTNSSFHLVSLKYCDYYSGPAQKEFFLASVSSGTTQAEIFRLRIAPFVDAWRRYVAQKPVPLLCFFVFEDQREWRYSTLPVFFACCKNVKKKLKHLVQNSFQCFKRFCFELEVLKYFEDLFDWEMIMFLFGRKIFPNFICFIEDADEDWTSISESIDNLSLQLSPYSYAFDGSLGKWLGHFTLPDQREIDLRKGPYAETWTEVLNESKYYNPGEYCAGASHARGCVLLT